MKSKTVLAVAVTLVIFLFVPATVSAHGFSSIMSKLNELETRLNELEVGDLDLENLYNRISDAPIADLPVLQVKIKPSIPAFTARECMISANISYLQLVVGF